ncbi:tripartite tricarboxylate transporter substrate binding protein [Ideonella livida]|uniref:Tripartite tricarboxylate transporter substrate binding protein n=1 Tax=Ideonella livida TaxID=2707176 RepID=A0A7C9PF75_9BURK|nr:tripartite tricarboxylate transporter substrate binding protein [Ideonella livida]NDY90397.1 tripartite tricarboxylate transporter substrate binding protein [Ideonella livida]
MSSLISRRTVLASPFALLGGMASAQASLPKQVNLMVPYPAGGPSDAIARLVDKPLAKAAGQMVIVENLGGVSGALAAQKVLSAPADGGYVFQGSPNELILAPLANAAVKLRSEDFRPVQLIGVAPIAILARKGLAAGHVDELIALARKAAADGKPLSYGSVGVGSFYHVLGAHFGQTVGATLNHVPYKGVAPLVQDIAGEQVDFAIVVVTPGAIALAEQGRMKVLGTLAPAGKPEVALLKAYPSINDSKTLHDFAFNIWTGYFVRKDTPEPVVQALHAALTQVLGDAGVRGQLEQLGMMVASPLSLAEASRHYEAQTARFRAIAKSIRLEAQ